MARTHTNTVDVRARAYEAERHALERLDAKLFAVYQLVRNMVQATQVRPDDPQDTRDMHASWRAIGEALIDAHIAIVDRQLQLLDQQ